jgi:hypothetical protein
MRQLTLKEGKKMKNLTTNLMLAAIALAAAPGMASAQQLKAEIPFGFRAQGTLVPAGTYTVTKDDTSSVPKFLLRSAESGKSILLVNPIQGDPKKAWEASGAAVLEFECGDSGCALNRFWSRRGAPAYTFSHPKAEKGERTHLAVIRLAVNKN